MAADPKLANSHFRTLLGCEPSDENASRSRILRGPFLLFFLLFLCFFSLSFLTVCFSPFPFSFYRLLPFPFPFPLDPQNRDEEAFPLQAPKSALKREFASFESAATRLRGCIPEVLGAAHPKMRCCSLSFRLTAHSLQGVWIAATATQHLCSMAVCILVVLTLLHGILPLQH